MPPRTAFLDGISRVSALAFLWLIVAGYTACGASQTAPAASKPSPSSPGTESLPVSAALLSTADAIVAEGRPLKRDAARRYSTALIRADDLGRLQAYIYCQREHCLAASDALLDAGGRLELLQIESRRPVMQGWIPAAALRALAALPGIQSITAPDYAFTR